MPNSEKLKFLQSLIIPAWITVDAKQRTPGVNILQWVMSLLLFPLEFVDLFKGLKGHISRYLHGISNRVETGNAQRDKGISL